MKQKPIAEDDISRWNETRILQLRPAYSTALATLGVPGTELSDAVDRVQAALTQAL
jgi:hypothetical protein